MAVVVDISAEAGAGLSPRGQARAAKWVNEEAPAAKEEYRKESVLDLVRARVGWLSVFFVGLLVAAVVVEQFEAMLRAHVELSFFVPLLIGHGGNTGSISTATVIRGLAMGQLRPADVLWVARKEVCAGTLMGAALGALVFLFSLVWRGFSPEVGLVVAISLPLVSLWANLLGAVLPLWSTHLGVNPAVAAAPLMTTVIDASGLLLYFACAKLIMKV